MSQGVESAGILQKDAGPESPRAQDAVPSPISGPQESHVTAAAPATRELISDAQEAMVESFVTGLLTCPEPYFDAFVDSWIEGHPESRTLLFVAYMTRDLVERFHKVGHACPAQESA